MSRHRLGACVLVALLVLASPASAWETAIDSGPQWKSIYVTVGTGFDHPNEHAIIAHDALKALGQHTNVGLAAEPLADFFFVDVASAVLHVDNQRIDDDIDLSTSIEERAAPSPAQFAGLPDLSYGVYDWINKNKTTLCPGVPAGVSTRSFCHEFKGWLGAGFNASHFGTQARELYVHLHRLALELAARARAMRAVLDPQTRPVEAALYGAFVMEAQLEALYYEGYAQHFLQDRWSTGHMWERWNGADYASITKVGGDATTFGHSFAVGSLSGLIHGSESVRRSFGLIGLSDGFEDPMCSPLITPSMRPVASCPERNEVFAHPATFRTAAGEILGGVGDYRYQDLLEGRFDARCVPLHAQTSQLYQDLPLIVGTQRSRMAACGQQGWGEVLAAFDEPVLAPGALPGVDLGLDTTFAGRDGLSCWGNWATNEAMYVGWAEDDVVKIGDAVRVVMFVKSPVTLPATEGFRWAMGNVGAKITSRYLADPEGTDLARGAMLPNLFKAQPGNNYVSAGSPVPDWTMPQGFSAPAGGPLPWRDDARGRDQLTMFGFFNRAHADFWCGNAERIASFRQAAGVEAITKAEVAKVDACTLLADRFYRKTDSAYEGLQTEQRVVSEHDAEVVEVAAGTPYEPICSFYGVTTSDDTETTPVELHPGYVSGPGDEDRFGHHSIRHWCQRVPVADYLWMASASVRDGHHWRQWDDDHRWDVVAVADREGGSTLVHGLSFAGPGTATLSYRECRTDNCESEGADVGRNGALEISYSPVGGGVTLDLPKDMAVGDFAIHFDPAEGPSSQGYFLVRVISEDLSAPQVLEVEWDNVKPGESATITAEVYDPDGWVDLDATQGAFVDVSSDILQGTITLNQSVSSGPDTATFTIAGGAPIKSPLNDKLASCAPPEYPVRSQATDTGLSVDPDEPKPRSGPLHKSEQTVLNCVPTVDAFSQAVKAKPGGTLSFSATFADDNHDGQAGCDELPAGSVHFDQHPGGLMTLSNLPALAWSATGSNPPRRSFATSVGVENPHRDRTFTAKIKTRDDRPGPEIETGDVTIEVENVAPVMVSVKVAPEAVHPGEATPITVTVVASDDNTWRDLTEAGGRVEVDLSNLNKGVANAVGPDGAGKRWTGARAEVVTAPETAVPIPIPVTAIDDDGATDMMNGVLRVENVPPELSGAGVVWGGGGELGQPGDGIIRACDPITLGGIATDKNRDNLRVDVSFEVGGQTLTANLHKGDGNIHVATILAPCPGSYTLTYQAVELHPDGSGRETLRSNVKTLQITVLPALDPCSCAECICAGVADDTSCDDCDTCTPTSTCQGGRCVGTPKVCPQDDNTCTEDTCDQSDGECRSRALADGEACDDGDVCTVGEECTGGVCGGGTQTSGCCQVDADCDDGKACTTDRCDEETGVCSNDAVEDATQCDDGDKCTTNDRCFGGVCGGTPITCGATGNPCASNVCDEADGQCKPVPRDEGGDCDDGDPCTSGTTCTGGVCGGGEPVAACCDEDADCDDAKECTTDRCDPGTGACTNVAVDDETECNDGDACTTNDRCLGGVCGGTAVTCGPTGNPCTANACDPQDGQCKPSAIDEGEGCDDGDDCTLGTTCSGGTCGGGTLASGCCQGPGDCDDGDVCTQDLCDETGHCANPPADGGQCSPTGQCVGSGAGVCGGGECTASFPPFAVPQGGAVYPLQAGAPAMTLPLWLDFAQVEVRYGLPSNPDNEVPCSGVGVAIEMREALPLLGDSSFIDITIAWWHPDFPGDPGLFGPPLQGATHQLSVGWSEGAWVGHLWVLQGEGPAASWVLADAEVPFVIDGDVVAIDRPIQGFTGCVPHKIYTQYLDSQGDLVLKMASAADAGVSLDPNQPPIPCPPSAGPTIP